MQKRNLYRVIYLLIITLCVSFDQVTKLLVINFLKPVGRVVLIHLPWLGDVFRLTYSENRGAAWGMFSDKRWVFMIFSTVALVALLLYLFRGISYLADKREDGTFPPIDLFCGIALSLIIGGGLGNMVDRVALGYVVDFIDVPIVKFIDFGSFPPTLGEFPIFNGADSCVTVGAVLLIVYLIAVLIRKRPKKENKESKEG